MEQLQMLQLLQVCAAPQSFLPSGLTVYCVQMLTRMVRDDPGLKDFAQSFCMYVYSIQVCI